MDIKTLKSRIPTLRSTLIPWLVAIVILGAGAIGAAVFRNQWLPKTNTWWSSMRASSGKTDRESIEDKHGEHSDHEEHEAEHAGHDETNSLELSPQARKNIGLKTAAIKLQPFVRTLSMPAMVAGRPGRSRIDVTAPLGGRVTRVYTIEGDAVEPGQPLFDLRLTHEELVQAQSELLRQAEQLDVEFREIRRLETLTRSGAIPGRRLLERQYEKQKLEAVLNAQRQSLLLHGLTQQQVEDIVQKRKLLQDVTVVTPEYLKEGNNVSPEHPFTVRTLHVRPGQYVDAGTTLCLLMDYAELYIQGRAFEQDADELLQAAREGWELSATLEDGSEQANLIGGLRIIYVDNEVDPESRALFFYVGLPNEVVLESKSARGHRFLTWRYKPGQRMQLRVPVQRWTDRIVLPVDGVAKEGVEYYVFQQNGDHFDRIPVHVEYQDQFWSVLANDGSLFPGDIVATRGAHQLQMAIKNKASGGVDPHAGHNH